MSPNTDWDDLAIICYGFGAEVCWVDQLDDRVGLAIEINKEIEVAFLIKNKTTIVAIEDIEVCEIASCVVDSIEVFISWEGKL